MYSSHRTGNPIFTDTQDEQETNRDKNILYALLCVYLCMIVLTVSFLIYLCKLKRRQFFEMAVTLSLVIKYIAIITFFALHNESIVNLMVKNSAGPFAHWLYASQYAKTCVLVPNSIKKTQSLFKNHVITNQQREQLRAEPGDQFIRRHQQLDEIMAPWKAWTKRVQCIFTSVDLAVAVFLLVLFFFVGDKILVSRTNDKIASWFLLIQPAICIFCMTILIACTLFLTKTLKGVTGRKRNTLLIVAHIIILGLVAITLVLYWCLLLLIASSDSDNKLNQLHNLQWYFEKVVLASFVIVDLFLLWLLYKFMRPQKQVGPGVRPSEFILFAQDAESLGQGLFEELTKRHDERQAIIQMKQSEEFLRYVLKECQEEMITENQISYEFLDPTDRDTFTATGSFISWTRQTQISAVTNRPSLNAQDQIADSEFSYHDSSVCE